MQEPALNRTAGPPNHGGLDAQELVDAIGRLCGDHRATAAQLRRACKRLAERTDNWPAQARRLERGGLTVQHLAATVHDVLQLPGDVAILQASRQSFYLLQRRQDRWQIVNGDGLLVADMPQEAADLPTEAVVLRMPVVVATASKGLGSLAALWPALRAAWAEVGLASLLINAGLLLVPLFSTLVYDKVVHNGVFETLWALTIGMVIYMFADAGMRMVRTWSTERVGESLTKRGDEVLWQRLIAQTDLPDGGFARFLSNYRDLSLSREFVSSTYLLAIADAPFLLLYLLVIGIVAWPLLVVSVVLMTVYTLAGLWLQKLANQRGQESEQQNTRKLAFMGEMLNALDVVRTVPGAPAFLRRWRDMADHSAGLDSKRRTAGAHVNTLSAFMQTASTVAILTAGAYLIDARLLSVGGLIAVNLLNGRAMGLVASLFMVTGKWQDFKRAVSRMEQSLSPAQSKEHVARPSVNGKIQVIGLTKRYENRPSALDGVSFSILPGERVALLGRPGAGKTTLLRCLAGLGKADEGQILIDGLALDDISQTDKARWMAWKSQTPALFAGTLDDNLKVAGSNHDAKRLSQAIWASGLESELSSGRMSLGMLLAERGGNLSGGQQQKVALARVLAQPSKILLLDEPTLGLDPESEQWLATRLPDLLSPTSVLIMTTHSAIMLQTVKRVIALDAGRVVADGLREKLVSTH